MHDLRRRRWLAGWCLAAASLIVLAVLASPVGLPRALASPWGVGASLAAPVAGQAFDFEAPEVEYQNLPYNGAFTFARVQFQPSRWGPGRYAWGLDLKWNHDYPRADERLPEILSEVTGIDANLGGSNIVQVGDPELFDYPWAYMCEVGFLTLTESEVENLRNYLLKGGFMVIDDFVGPYHWYNFEDQMNRVLPGMRFIPIDDRHPIFHAFFDLDDLSFGGGQYRGFNGGGSPRYYGLFEDNDPSKRMMMIVNFDNDIGEYWEFSDSPYLTIDLTNDAFKLGVNYVIYSTLH
jgi:hypothetical protein